MRRQFPLFQSHIDLAHDYWSKILTPEDIAVDATCGNGNDSLFLSELNPKQLHCVDLQQEAIETTKKLLKEHENIFFYNSCHSEFPKNIASESVKLIVYNLGYLPGGDKSVTTKTATTLLSLDNALRLIQPGGAVSVTCYPGHPEGFLEEEKILNWAHKLPPSIWNVCMHKFLNRNQSPSLLLIQKNILFH